MPKAHINISVELDSDRLPERILWQAEEGADKKPQATESMHLAFWDKQTQQIMRIALWTKEFPIDEMKRFYIDMIGSMSQGILQATGDTYMSKRIRELCEELATYHKESLTKAQHPT